MIKVKQIRIHEFRGIRDLTLNLEEKNFAVCGPNGTGKSGVVDALEFALTGEISRLSGKGTGGLSVKSHGPHVDSRNNLENSFVEVELSISHISESVSISRTVKDLNTPTISPNTPEILSAISEAALHPELVLSRREIIRYVLSEPGKRSEEIQALLRLHEIDEIRSILQKISNAAKRDCDNKKTIKEKAVQAVCQTLGIAKLDAAELLQSVNEKRQLLNLTPINTFTPEVSIKDGLITASSQSGLSRISKKQARDALQAIRNHYLLKEDPTWQVQVASAVTDLQALKADADTLQHTKKESLLRSALDMFDENLCPVCETQWKPEDFRQHIKEKLQHYKEVTEKRQSIEKQLAPIAAQLQKMSLLLKQINFGHLLEPTLSIDGITAAAQSYEQSAQSLQGVLPLEKAEESLMIAADFIDINDILKAFEDAIAGLPEPSAQDAARDYLVVGNEKILEFRQANADHKVAEYKSITAKTVLDIYGEITTNALETIYKEVEDSLVELYRIINKEDESAFRAELKPSIGKLGFNVDFYGRGFFPPGAYHSEGHQDGMGLCLYLALMRHLSGADFTFAVLDDVVMSVDAHHRREVCHLLKTQFPNTQFVITTHDRIWLQHMQSEGLIEKRACAHFRKWDVNNGPVEWDERDIWEEIAGNLESNNIEIAAGLLRRYLEHISQEICYRLGASVRFRGDAQYTLGDTLPPAFSKMKKLLREAKVTAQSWDQINKTTQILALEEAFKNELQKTEVDKWQINAAVHYNAWATLHKNEFQIVVTNYKNILNLFRCETCSSLLYISPPDGPRDSLKCSCGEISFTLKQKPKVNAQAIA